MKALHSFGKVDVLQSLREKQQRKKIEKIKILHSTKYLLPLTN